MSAIAAGVASIVIGQVGCAYSVFADNVIRKNYGLMTEETTHVDIYFCMKI